MIGEVFSKTSGYAYCPVIAIDTALSSPLLMISDEASFEIFA